LLEYIKVKPELFGQKTVPHDDSNLKETTQSVGLITKPTLLKHKRVDAVFTGFRYFSEYVFAKSGCVSRSYLTSTPDEEAGAICNPQSEFLKTETLTPLKGVPDESTTLNHISAPIQAGVNSSSPF
jgi:hypothetical protein